jgi:hypothetical protein
MHEVGLVLKAIQAGVKRGTVQPGDWISIRRGWAATPSQRA